MTTSYTTRTVPSTSYTRRTDINYILREDGTYLLREDGNKFLREDAYNINTQYTLRPTI